MIDGKFLTEGNTAPAGQDIVIGLLNRCLLWSDIVLTRFAALSSLNATAVEH